MKNLIIYALSIKSINPYITRFHLLRSRVCYRPGTANFEYSKYQSMMTSHRDLQNLLEYQQPHLRNFCSRTSSPLLGSLGAYGESGLGGEPDITVTGQMARNFELKPCTL